MRYLLPVCLACLWGLVGCAPSNSSKPVTANPPAPTSPGPSAASSEGRIDRAAGEPASSDEMGNQVDLEAISLTAPEGWTRKKASSSFVMAEFELPRAEGDPADGRLTVSVAGGSVEANVERWKGQFGGKPTNESQRDMEVDGVTVTRVDLAGEFNDQRGPFAPATPQPNYRMMAAIIPIGETLHFIKATGPEKTLEAHAEKFDEFIKSLKRKEK